MSCAAACNFACKVDTALAFSSDALEQDKCEEVNKSLLPKKKLLVTETQYSDNYART